MIYLKVLLAFLKTERILYYLLFLTYTNTYLAILFRIKFVKENINWCT